MQLFSCDICQSPVFFDNFKCTSCRERLSFLPDRLTMSVMQLLPVEPGKTPNAENEPGLRYRALENAGKPYRMCLNAVEHEACNWAVSLDDPEPLCRACRLNDVIPNLDVPTQREAWLQLESAKRRLMYSLYMLRLPVESRAECKESGLCFRFMAGEREKQVFTGHVDGVITINVAEADDPFREKMRAQLGEAYRTLLGHFRHEIGHYYWDRLIKDSPLIDTYRALFGDERVSYKQALERHYREGPAGDWTNEYVSAYASMHPWEDWAETWAHYLHIFDTLETAKTYGLQVRFAQGGDTRLVDAAGVDSDDFDKMARDWVPMTVALNSMNRSMGLRDLYPFVLTDTALRKLRFVHEVIRSAGQARAHVSAPDAHVAEIAGEARDAALARNEANARVPDNDVVPLTDEPRSSRMQPLRLPEDTSAAQRGASAVAS